MKSIYISFGFPIVCATSSKENCTSLISFNHSCYLSKRLFSDAKLREVMLKDDQ